MNYLVHVLVPLGVTSYLTRVIFVYRLEEEFAAQRSSADLPDSDELKNSRRGSGSARRSFFRRKKHQRNNSKDSREFQVNDSPGYTLMLILQST